MKDYQVIKTKVVRQVTRARLYDETVAKVKAGHPEVPAELPVVIQAVSTAIESPTQVEKTDEKSYVFVDANSTNASGDPFRVPVKVVRGTSTRVASYYFATPDYEPEIIWRKADATD